MNLICSIFLTFFTVFRPLIPLVEYAVNYQYISEELCVNKKNLTLNCNGKCYLAKELSKTADTDSSPLHKTKNSGQKLLDIYVLPEIIACSTTEKSIFSHSNFLYKTDYSFLFLKFIFRPPVF
ncbi:hypothetical protein [Chryseobacterium turcicum]|uniref:Uncharacterized protein n=1 Tax=Chryseobacterium turcicum TaxID=2898076 RepID=A0A9Q3YWU9_9FLAO|nr:hypothetical protein [Chryseobacterium turcicum]MCD1118946.1 hypothetical protein [Chryseobacterium turcicum]